MESKRLLIVALLSLLCLLQVMIGCESKTEPVKQPPRETEPAPKPTAEQRKDLKRESDAFHAIFQKAAKALNDKKKAHTAGPQGHSSNEAVVDTPALD